MKFTYFSNELQHNIIAIEHPAQFIALTVEQHFAVKFALFGGKKNEREREKDNVRGKVFASN